MSALVAVGVHKILREDDTDKTVLHVRCYEGAVRCDMEFRHAFGAKPWRREGIPLSVHLTVVRIELYGREFDILEEGITGAISVTGLVPSEIGEGWVLTQ